jgi:hypothetical protein
MADLDIDDRPFIPADWIARGKQYSDAPFEVISAKNAVFELPAPAQATEMILSASLSVAKFCSLPSPRISSELIYGESQMWFRNDEPTTEVSLLMGRSIPPATVLELLKRKSGQACLNGANPLLIPGLMTARIGFPSGP